jgi:hypothetical protein
MSWLVWVLPIGLFWPVASIYLGGMLELQGGGPARQLIGLLVSLVAFLLLWWVLGRLLAPVGPVLGKVVLATLLSVIAMPVLIYVGYRVVGIRVVRAAEVH